LISIDFNEKQKLLQITQFENGDVCKGIQKSVDPRFHTLLERPYLTSPDDVQKKMANARLLSNMQVISPLQKRPQEAWTPSPSPKQEKLQVPLAEIKPTSKVALIAR
jgi:hypothetical protein